MGQDSPRGSDMSGAALYRLAQADPTAHSYIATHVNAYPELVSWIAQYSPDPQARNLANARIQNPLAASQPEASQPTAQSQGATPPSHGYSPITPSHSQPAQPATTPGTLPDQRPKKTRIIALAAILLVIIVILVSVFLLWPDRSDDGSISPQNQTPSPSSSEQTDKEVESPPLVSDTFDPYVGPIPSFTDLTFDGAVEFPRSVDSGTLFDPRSNVIADGATLFHYVDGEVVELATEAKDIERYIALYNATAIALNKDQNGVTIIDASNGDVIATYEAENAMRIVRGVISQDNIYVFEQVAESSQPSTVAIDTRGNVVWEKSNFGFDLDCPAGTQTNAQNGVRWIHGERECTTMLDTTTGSVYERDTGRVIGQYPEAVVIYEENRAVIYDADMSVISSGYDISRDKLLSPAGLKDVAGRTPYLSDVVTLNDLKRGLEKLETAPPDAGFYGVIGAGRIVEADFDADKNVTWRGNTYACDDGFDIVDGGNQMVCYRSDGVLQLYEAGSTEVLDQFSPNFTVPCIERFNGATWVLRNNNGKAYLLGQ